MKLGLLPRIVIAIVIGVVAGSFLPESRLLLTFNDLFSQFLGFFIPILIVGLVIPSIAEIGSGAGRMLALTALLAYGSTVVAGFVSYFTGAAIFPHLIGRQKLGTVLRHRRIKQGLEPVCKTRKRSLVPFLGKNQKTKRFLFRIFNVRISQRVFLHYGTLI